MITALSLLAACAAFVYWEICKSSGCEGVTCDDCRCQGFMDDGEQDEDGSLRRAKEGFSDGRCDMGVSGNSGSVSAGLGYVSRFITDHGGSVWEMDFRKGGHVYSYRCRSELTQMMFRHWMALAKDETHAIAWGDCVTMMNEVRDSDVLMWEQV